MKLVTGIEAIQSGKPWKHKSYDGWMTDSMIINNLTSAEFRKKEFIIKEEPREFWINVSSMLAHDIKCGDPDRVGSNWIRVREVEK